MYQSSHVLMAGWCYWHERWFNDCNKTFWCLDDSFGSNEVMLSTFLWGLITLCLLNALLFYYFGPLKQIISHIGSLNYSIAIAMNLNVKRTFIQIVDWNRHVARCGTIRYVIEISAPYDIIRRKTSLSQHIMQCTTTMKRFLLGLLAMCCSCR